LIIFFLKFINYFINNIIYNKNNNIYKTNNDIFDINTINNNNNNNNNNIIIIIIIIIIINNINYNKTNNIFYTNTNIFNIYNTMILGPAAQPDSRSVVWQGSQTQPFLKCWRVWYRAEHFWFGPVLDQNKQPNQNYFLKVF
jgi:hypothetical protein